MTLLDPRLLRNPALAVNVAALATGLGVVVLFCRTRSTRRTYVPSTGTGMIDR